MLREYQEEIKKLRDQLEAAQRGEKIYVNGVEVSGAAAMQSMADTAERESRLKFSEEEIEEITRKAQMEKEIILKQAQVSYGASYEEGHACLLCITGGSATVHYSSPFASAWMSTGLE
jgi:preprotein translocase subunit SecD